MVNFDYNRVMAQVRELREISACMQDMKNHAYLEVVNDVQKAWKGDASKLFMGVCSDAATQIEKEANNILNIVAELEKAAEHMRQTEITAIHTI
jgi:uncharacterized protein YukE